MIAARAAKSTHTDCPESKIHAEDADSPGEPRMDRVRASTSASTVPTGAKPTLTSPFLPGIVPFSAVALGPNLSLHRSYRGEANLGLNLCLCLYLQFGPSLRLTLLVRKHGQTYRRLCLKLRRALRRQLNRALNLKLHGPLYAAFYDEMRAALYRKSDRSLFVSSFGTLCRKKYRSFDGPICLQPYRQLQLPRRPPGRPPGGRIVVGAWPATAYR